MSTVCRLCADDAPTIAKAYLYGSATHCRTLLVLLAGRHIGDLTEPGGALAPTKPRPSPTPGTTPCRPQPSRGAKTRPKIRRAKTRPKHLRGFSEAAGAPRRQVDHAERVCMVGCTHTTAAAAVEPAETPRIPRPCGLRLRLQLQQTQLHIGVDRVAHFLSRW